MPKMPKPAPAKTAPVGRLALRAEGDWWNAYYALPNSMDDALHLGSIRMAFVQTDERRQAFITLISEAVQDILEELVGERPTMNDPVVAPQHERAGRA